MKFAIDLSNLSNIIISGESIEDAFNKFKGIINNLKIEEYQIVEEIVNNNMVRRGNERVYALVHNDRNIIGHIKEM